ncbi:hypothetical protein A2833_03410 [Candidatus Azambacteria bacterium RIFCSPHIGHO2_01_FULL_44_55]|uniref:Vitamin K epoxide reductase domain-containing protein n=1 Tax=Candidatus Azambacteria bacterium RIFCSPLOWO2_02_FULL_44_14 TaxID=1797306 RepID=A0A1F5CCD8_9BACT|nr:MAG: hypothetical protein A3A18_00745 [Candidatus Azambacteria bacterium RIFCSPLOWO2_01_FULL_44_84]OGD32869.1 MAG: hypothetical protein A3C78_00890 [Candidatus Azambacteria bacterium RIFCSPHIGHO2_02_FULL_45_18]OGD39773.1 MAG: hypothetical protein A2833_03410 [Candidatus Azambacteria bacterium RIFCSPHIGHO2_01_FULL_44_55]OGD40512.1 MAG: hypothetical protein A3I30_00920 [Candidatus Azambacteria bacterium RIFCSPLOWO2_02_FULL_44_14]OGD52250.1 MAG: hypothetical protein A2608_02750 [Candidatus Azam
MKSFILISILVLALIGALDASYLLVKTLESQPVACPSVPVGQFDLGQCNIVLFSSYAKTLSLPNALYGLVAYLLFGLLALYELVQKKQTGTMKPLAYFSGLGVLAFVYFVYLQFFVIKALCLYCLVSALVMALIFALSVAYNVKYSKNPGV